MPDSKRKQRVIIGFVLAYLGCACFLIPLLAGGLYFLANKTMPHGIGLSTWSTYWHFYAADPTQRKYLQFAMGAAALLVIGLPLMILNAILNKDRSLHGDARFATTSEVRKDGLFGAEGVIIGKMAGQYLSMAGTAPLLLAAPTRQGKGAGVVISNLLNYPDSIVVLDIKLENFQITSLFRARHGQKVFLFNPFAEDGRSHRWNPMDAIRRDPNLRTVDAMTIGEMLYPRSNDDSGMWNDLARDLFMGFVLYLIETPELPCTFGEVLRQISGKGRSIKEHVQHLMAARNRGTDALSDACFEAFSRFCSAQERTLSSIVTTATAPLLIFQNAYVDAATSATDFDLSRVRMERMTIYVGIPANMMSASALIVNLFFSHLINRNMKELPEQNPALKHQCLILLDEFTALGRVGIIAKSIGQISGYNIRLLLVIQGISQLISAYGEHDARTIEDNCAVQLLYPPRQQKDANEYSEMLGAYTAKATSTGISRPRALGNSTGSQSENVSDHRRALMLPQELRELPWTNEVIIKAGLKPILCDKALYFADRVFMDRLKALSATLAKIKGLPSELELKLVALTNGELSIGLPQHNIDVHMAKVERRLRPLKAGEPIEVGLLAIDPAKLPRPPSGAEPTPAMVRELTNTFIDSLDGPLIAREPEEGDVPLKHPDGVDLAALTAAAGRLPSPDRLLKPNSPAAIPSSKPIGPLRRRLGVIDLDALKKKPLPVQRAASAST